MSSWYERLLIYDVKRTTKIDGMGPFNETCQGKTNCITKALIKGSGIYTEYSIQVS